MSDPERSAIPGKIMHHILSPRDQQTEMYLQVYEKQTNEQIIRDIADQIPESPKTIAANIIFERRRIDAVNRDRDTLASRHTEIKDELKKMQKPHWTTAPNFWLTALSAFSAVLAAYFAWLAIRK